MNWRARIFKAALVLAVGYLAFDTPSLLAVERARVHDVGFRAQAVSDDGRVVVGSDLYEAWRWTREGGAQRLGALNGMKTVAWDVSSDGSVILGTASNLLPDEQPFVRPFLWTESQGLRFIDEVHQEARAISGDGRFVAGWGRPGWRWTEQSGKMDMTGGDEGRFWAVRPAGLSFDGSAVAGTGLFEVSGGEAFLWTASGGIRGLGQLFDLPNAQTFGNDISADGRVVVGDGNAPSRREAFRWKDGVMTALGDLPGGDVASTAYAVSSDGSIVVGSGSVERRNHAFIWDEAHGMRQLSEALIEDHGIDLNGWSFESAMDISADGRVIVGFGSNTMLGGTGWIVLIPEPSVFSMLLLGAMVGLRRRRR